jgi:hypothetical protein
VQRLLNEVPINNIISLVCVREEDAGRRSYMLLTHTAGKDSPAREPSWLLLLLQKPSILRVCVREENAGKREAGKPLMGRG